MLPTGAIGWCDRNPGAMQLETKYLRLRMPVTIGSRFGPWKVCWLGGWTKDGLAYLVMVVRIIERIRR